MTPFQQWSANVRNHPERMVIDKHQWRDMKNGWSVRCGNGILSYGLQSPHGGNIRLSIVEKFSMYRLLKWWAAGSLGVDKSAVQT